MDVARQSGQVSELLREILQEEPLPGIIRRAIRRYLAAPGRGLGQGARGWTFLTLACCEALQPGKGRMAAPAAAAMEFLVVAGDILDDVQDGDSAEISRRPGAHLWLNASLAAVLLCGKALLQLPAYGVSINRVNRIQRLVSTSALTALSGQQRDLDYEGRRRVTLEEALHMTQYKAAPLLRCSCQIGAAVATEDEGLISLFGQLGWHVGVAAQLENDVRDLADKAGGKSDLLRRKKTVPLVYALSLRPCNEKALLVKRHLGATQSGVPGAVASEDELRMALLDVGAFHFTLALADMHRRRALSVLDDLESLCAARGQVRSLLGPLCAPIMGARYPQPVSENG